MDVQPDCLFSEFRVTTHHCNSTDEVHCRAWKQITNLTFYIIVDNGSRWGERQLATLENLWPILRSGGYYVIEDVMPDSLVSQEPHSVYEIVGDVGIFFAGLKNNLCVTHKVPLQCCRDHF